MKLITFEDIQNLNCELPEKCPLNRFWVKYRI